MPEQQLLMVQAGKSENVQLALLKGLLPGVWVGADGGLVVDAQENKGRAVLRPAAGGRWDLHCRWHVAGEGPTWEALDTLTPLEAVSAAIGFVEEHGGFVS